MRHWLIIIVLLIPNSGLLAQLDGSSPGPGDVLDPELQRLAADFFAWRSKQQPVSGDDISRAERPPGWLPAWSREDLAV